MQWALGFVIRDCKTMEDQGGRSEVPPGAQVRRGAFIYLTAKCLKSIFLCKHFFLQPTVHFSFFISIFQRASFNLDEVPLIALWGSSLLGNLHLMQDCLDFLPQVLYHAIRFVIVFESLLNMM